jgi:hypothetical protein
VNTKTKNYKINQSNQKKSNKKLYIGLVSALIILLIIGYFVYGKNNSPVVYNEEKTTSTAETAQSDFTGGNERPVQEANKDKGDAIVSDNSGSISVVPDESNWTTSASKEITLYSPSQNQLIKNGDSISGESTLSVVSFRIIDDISGVIAMGELSVVNGKFSGDISFSTSAASGRLDIFGTRADGGEFSNIEVPVLFK